jgi:4-alpha-glucanotransferase
MVRALVDEHPPDADAYAVANASPPGCAVCVAPTRRLTGIAVQIYSLWSEQSQGIGDLIDVATLAELSGADVLLLSPLHAPNDGFPQQSSPYFPSSRERRNPLLARVDGVSLPNDPDELIDRDAVWKAKRDLVTDELVEQQLRHAANAGAGLIHDIAVGFDPDGYDAHRWRDLIAPGMHIGAPPDALGPQGQNWGVPPFVPHLLTGADFAPIRAALESAAAFGAGVRIDHVMGLFRLFWIPEGAEPADGVYVRYPAAALLDVVAEISQRHNVFVVGEDLGTVEPGVREALHRRQVLSYKVLLFEDDPPEGWPALSLAAATTHDLPTLTGQGMAVDDVHRRLLRAGSSIVVLTAEDLVGAVHQPNEPGTVKPTNWSRRLPVPVREVARAFRRAKALAGDG